MATIPAAHAEQPPLPLVAITFAVMAAIIMNVLDTTIVNVALPNMEGALRANAD